MKNIEVKVVRAMRRDRKIVLVIESDLFSDETFAVTPFYDEGPVKNQLQSITFDVSITEKSGEVQAKVSFGNCLHHFTKGHSQLHTPINRHFIDKKDCARNWFMTEQLEYFTDERIRQILKLWEIDKHFHSELKDLATARLAKLRMDKLKDAEKKHSEAIDEMKIAAAELLTTTTF